MKNEGIVEFIVGWTLDGPIIVRHYLYEKEKVAFKKR